MSKYIISQRPKTNILHIVSVWTDCKSWDNELLHNWVELRMRGTSGILFYQEKLLSNHTESVEWSREINSRKKNLKKQKSTQRVYLEETVSCLNCWHEISFWNVTKWPSSIIKLISYCSPNSLHDGCWGPEATSLRRWLKNLCSLELASRVWAHYHPIILKPSALICFSSLF